MHIQVPSLSFLAKQLCVIRFFSSSNFSALDRLASPGPPLRGSPTRRGSRCGGGISPGGGPRGRWPFIFVVCFLYSSQARFVQEVSAKDQGDMIGRIGETDLADGILRNNGFGEREHPTDAIKGE